MLANVCKLNVTRCPYEIARIAEDLAGGLMVTLPPEVELKNPAVSEYIHKYLNTSETVPTETRIKMLRLIENLTIGSGAVAYRTESMHGAGSPQAMKVMINRQANIEEKKGFAKKIARVSESK
jgi:4-hydroxybutyryl-CoA dehydratase/vinylacetyl-CoA-Delta-isomerase